MVLMSEPAPGLGWPKICVTMKEMLTYRILFSAALWLVSIAPASFAGDSNPSPEKRAPSNGRVALQPTEAESDAADNQPDPSHLQRLRSDLNANAQAYPNSEELEQRRQQMLERMQQRFMEADEEGKGGLNRQQLSQSFPRAAEHFDQIDANHDGMVTLEEMLEARERMQRQIQVQREAQPAPEHSKRKSPKPRRHPPREESPPQEATPAES